MFTSTLPTTASADILVAQTFGAVNPEPVPEKSARLVSDKTQNLNGFLSDQDRVSITPQAREKAQASQLEQDIGTKGAAAEPESADEPTNEFIQVSSSIGRAASTGNLRRDEAMAIYQKIAALI